MERATIATETTAAARQPSEATMPKPTAGVIIRACLGLAILLTLARAGGTVQQNWHLTLPGPVIGLAWLAGVLLLAERWHTGSHRQLTRQLVPVSRQLVAHMGLLFVPAGAGIITQGAVLRREWLPILAAVAGSTLLGLVATGWLMHRFPPRKPLAKP